MKHEKSSFTLCKLCYTKLEKFLPKNRYTHGLRTPNEGKNQRNLKIQADVADKICCRHT